MSHATPAGAGPFSEPPVSHAGTGKPRFALGGWTWTHTAAETVLTFFYFLSEIYDLFQLLCVLSSVSILFSS